MAMFKINTLATQVTISTTVVAGSWIFSNSAGYSRRVWRNRYIKIAVIDLNDDSTSQIKLLIGQHAYESDNFKEDGYVDKSAESRIFEFTADDAESAILFTNNQIALINQAFIKNTERGLLGGVAIIKTKAKMGIEEHEDYIAECKVGEFTGVVRNSYSIKSTATRPSNNELPLDDLIAMIKSGYVFELNLHQYLKVMEAIDNGEFEVTEEIAEQLLAFKLIPGEAASKVNSDRLKGASRDRGNGIDEAVQIIRKQRVANARAAADEFYVTRPNSNLRDKLKKK